MGGMHTSFFEMKHGHLTALRITRKETAIVELTPARLDMLRVILERSGEMLQSSLRRLLCVNNSVISIMVRALERAGFVVRERCRDDRRTFWVRLTARARYALRRVFYGAVNQGFLELTLVSAFAKDHIPHRGWEKIVEELQARLHLLRIAFGIGITHYNPWDANDEDWAFYYAAVIPNPNRVDIAPEDDPYDDPPFIEQEVPDTDRPEWQ